MTREDRNDRKKQLIAQGAVYRAEVLFARQEAEESLRPDTLARSVLHKLAGAALSAFRHRREAGLAGIDLKTLLPLVMGGVSALSRRKPLARTLLRGAAVAGLAAGAAALLSRRKNAASALQAASPDDPAAQI